MDTGSFHFGSFLKGLEEKFLAPKRKKETIRGVILAHTTASLPLTVEHISVRERTIELKGVAPIVRQEILLHSAVILRDLAAKGIVVDLLR